ncbi:penicillin-binding protein 2 [Pseudoroseicyclus tamaricis]|uniref:Beta-lactamase n=1 Tax=Pseudoroseicyclus tamaricis TaxID=2705421 RepID=A0A6B2K320_9RHOB|nr:penicillin-binding protein 2 [Pseudoroseicyclus tamaricis]NDV02202.1 penicillin-binding protein 2 [Pseudoroseicyclus tamaricis]
MKRPTRSDALIQRRFSRRALVLGGLQAGVVGVLGWRMHSMQVDHADEFRMLAEENRINIRLLPPARGLIFDRNGVLLAGNEQNYRIVITREDAGDIEEAFARLTKLVDIDPELVERAKEEMARRSPFVPVTIADRVAWEDVAKITANAPALPGITADVGLSRVYPLGSDTAHVVGYVGPVSDYDLTEGYLAEDDDPLLQIPKFQVGKTGAESRMEDQLRGSAGTRRIEVNALGRVMRELDREDGDAGADVQLTIDAHLQRYVQARLEGESAAAVVIDTETGDIRAMASSPSFDPNLFVRGISVADYNGLLNDNHVPLSGKAVSGGYPPGSTFKLVTSLAALEAGEVEPEETIWCGGYTNISGIRFHCWRPGGHGNVSFHESIKQSCDCYYYEASQRVGIDKMAEMARKLGLGVRHDLPLSAITPGIAPDKAWKRERYGEEWRIGDTVNASIGQGYVLASPLQLAVMTARVATGRSVTPRLVHTIDGVEQPSGRGESLGLNENNLRRLRAAMYDVVNHQRGTGYGTRTVLDEAKIAGKSGTSQVRRITPEERARGVTSNDDLPWNRRDHALWVDFAPFDNPRYAVCVVVEHGGGGSSVAGPIGRDITLQALYDGDPPLEAYPSNMRGRMAEQQEHIRGLAAQGATATIRA